jgi:hypothetical protein
MSLLNVLAYHSNIPNLHGTSFGTHDEEAMKQQLHDMLEAARIGMAGDCHYECGRKMDEHGV